MGIPDFPNFYTVGQHTEHVSNQKPVPEEKKYTELAFRQTPSLAFASHVLKAAKVEEKFT
jgi:hypothetical protein